MISLLATFTVSLAAAVVFMSMMFLVARRLGRYDIVDVAWGIAFVVIGVTSLLLNQSTATSLTVLVLVSIWGGRLSSHIYRRLRATTEEDKRYVELRKKWKPGNQSIAIYLRIYLVQALLASVVSLPVIVLGTAHTEAQRPFFWIGLLLWAAGFVIEATSDRQLRMFMQEPRNKGRLMTSGLWRYSRHPNYFGELLQWWSIGVIALGVPQGWIGLAGPLLISYLIVFISGIPPMEKAFEEREGWSQYKSHTSALIPWLVRNNTRT